jgi:hypothetical protein
VALLAVAATNRARGTAATGAGHRAAHFNRGGPSKILTGTPVQRLRGNMHAASHRRSLGDNRSKLGNILRRILWAGKDLNDLAVGAEHNVCRPTPNSKLLRNARVP